MITSLAEPVCSVMSTCRSLPVSSSKFCRSKTLNPLASARTLYVPGSRLRATYAPLESVVSTLDVPLARSMMVTVASAIAPPDWSMTVPRIRPVFPCGIAGEPNRTAAAKIARTGVSFMSLNKLSMALPIELSGIRDPPPGKRHRGYTIIRRPMSTISFIPCNESDTAGRAVY